MKNNQATGISVQKLYKSFGEIQAVDGISFEIEGGQALGLLGPNGAGKTTTISMMIGLLEPDSGSVQISGSSPTNPQTRRQIGLAPQTLSLYAELTARENLQFFGQLYNYSHRQLQDRVRWALDFAGLSDRARDRVETYSGGMKRRLNLACAMLHEPRVVLLDEPTVGVDPQSRNHLFECIEQLKHAGLTIIYTTHYMEEAQRLCDRVAIIDHGKLMAIDSVEGLIARHGGDSLVLAEFQQPPIDATGLPGVCDDVRWRVETSQPMHDIATATQQGNKFHTLQITQPDLESVFLSLTGRRLRD